MTNVATEILNALVQDAASGLVHGTGLNRCFSLYDNLTHLYCHYSFCLVVQNSRNNIEESGSQFYNDLNGK